MLDINVDVAFTPAIILGTSRIVGIHCENCCSLKGLLEVVLVSGTALNVFATQKKLKLILLQINQTVRNSLHVCKKCHSMTTFLAHKNSKLCLPGSWKLSKSCLLVSFHFLSRLERDWKKTKPFTICMVIVNVL